MLAYLIFGSFIFGVSLPSAVPSGFGGIITALPPSFCPAASTEAAGDAEAMVVVAVVVARRDLDLNIARNVSWALAEGTEPPKLASHD